ncbi:hypothetical protein AAEO56_11920 [Flavobacterium sp. DGU11]|uniref:Uncharacterized protein n=1 Tax=Flavobacterium arundinis TaxID=3139143 RepID=A0ABU9HYW1_9FLAO
MKNEKSTAFLYDTHQQAEHVVGELQENGADMKLISMVMTHFKNCSTPIGYYEAGARVKKLGNYGRSFDTLTGSALLVLPGLGPLLIIGPFANAIVRVLEAKPTAGAEGVVCAALQSLGVPLHEARKHETLIKTGKFMLVVQGMQDRLRQPIDKPPFRIARHYLREDNRKIILSGGEHSPFQ